jgi:hypothetical protein
MRQVEWRYAGPVKDRERTLAAAVEASVGAVMFVAGALLLHLSGFGKAVGMALLVLGVVGLGHALLVGFGIITLPGAQEGDKARRDVDESDGG